MSEELTLEERFEALSANTDAFYSLICGALIFFMQCGFAMLCAGSIRQKNVKNIMLKNLLDACGGALGYWAIGFSLAFGEGGKFIGTSTERFFLHDFTGYIEFFFQFTFAATAATIVAGTVAERCKMIAYAYYSVFLTGFVYPVVVHAIWNEDGFLSAFNPDPFRGVGMIDFAGSGVVHMTGGATALVAAVVLGPRIGRFTDEDGNVLEEVVHFPPHSVSLQVLGTFILWTGWYGFNPGSTLKISPLGYGDVASLCAVTTTLSAATGCISAMVIDTSFNYWKSGEVEYDLAKAMNGCLGGLVAITAGCSVVAPWASVVIGLFAGLIYVGCSLLLIKLRIDDAVDAIPVHFFNGIWGCLSVGLFASPSKILIAYGSDEHVGWFYSWGRGSGDANLLLCQIAGVAFIIAWTVGIMLPFFSLLHALNFLRIDPLEERVGMDFSHHKGAAYDYSGPKKADMEEFRKDHSHRRGGLGDSSVKSRRGGSSLGESSNKNRWEGNVGNSPNKNHANVTLEVGDGNVADVETEGLVADT